MENVTNNHVFACMKTIENTRFKAHVQRMNDDIGNTMETEGAEPPKRGPGRPKGLPKTGGRKPGGRNRITADVKEAILIDGKPLETLFAVVRGRRMKAADPADPKKVAYVYPSLDARTAAARTLLAKVVPDIKATELSGPDGGPIRTEDAAAEAKAREHAAHALAMIQAAAGDTVENVTQTLLEAGDAEYPSERETLRRALFALNGAISKAKDKGESTESLETIHARLMARWNALLRSRDAQPAPAATSGAPEPETRATGDSGGLTVAENANAPICPKPGEECFLDGGHAVLRNTGPDREGLPDKLAVLRYGQIMRTFPAADFPAAVAWCREKFNLGPEVSEPRVFDAIRATPQVEDYVKPRRAFRRIEGD